MPLPAVWDPKYGPVYKGQVCLSDAESDTTAKTSAGGVSVSSNEWPTAALELAAPSPPALADPDGPYPDECLDYTQGKCTNGENCQFKHYGLDAKGNKKQVCLGFVKGRCTYGLKCKFLHHAFDPATQTWREACVQHLNYKCTRGDDCQLLHVAARKKNKSEGPRSRPAPPRQEAKFPAKQASQHPTWYRAEHPAARPSGDSHAPYDQRHAQQLTAARAAVTREVLETRAHTLLISLDYAVGIDDMLGMLAWCGLDSPMYDLVLPPAAANEHGFIRFTAPEYAARFVEACDISECVCYPAIQSLPVLLKKFADRLPPNYDDPYVLLVRDNGRNFIQMKVNELLETLRREPNPSSSYPEHGRVISEPRLKDTLNRPRFDAYGGSAKNSDGGIHRGRR